MASIQKKLAQTHTAAATLLQLPKTTIKRVVLDFAISLLAAEPAILAANKKDLSKLDTANPLYDRLMLNSSRLKALAAGIRAVANLQDPAFRPLQQQRLSNGLRLQKLTVPLGVVAAIFESRPNVVADIAALCIKSRNACVLKGSKDAIYTNRALVQLLHQTLAQHQLPTQLVLLLPPKREVVHELFTATRYLDVIIPRGSNSLINFVRQHSQVPVIETGAGVCHVYVHKDADIEMAVQIVINAKTSRPSVCNAMDTVLVDNSIAPRFLRQLAEVFATKGVIMYADPKAHALLKNYPFLYKASGRDFYREFLSLTCAVKIVPDEQAAMAHIAEHGTRHSEAIVTNNKKVAEQFLQLVDAAAVFHNASTRFTDGAVFGLGAEVGISTQKLHARGPFALEKLVTEKWVLRGNGQVRT